MGDSKDRTLWVGGLSERVTEDLLYELFLQSGPLERVSIPKGKRFAFITFKHDCSVPYTIQLMKGISLHGQQLKLQSRSGSIHDQGHQGSPQPHGSSPQDPGMRGRPSPGVIPVISPGQSMHRSNTWHGGDLSKHGSPSYGGNIISPQPSPTAALFTQQPAWYSSSPQNMDPLTMQIRRERILQQQTVMLNVHRHQQQQQSHNYGNASQQPWQQQDLRRRY